MAGRLVIVTGPPGAGKSTIAHGLASAWAADAALHIHSDDLWTYFVKGRIPPWEPRSAAQNLVVTDAMASQAAALGVAFPVFFDGVVGPWFLRPFSDAARSRGVKIDYMVLRPGRDTTIKRGVARDHPMRDAEVIGRMWDQFADLGGLEHHVLDTTLLSIGETITVATADLLSNRFQLA